MKCSTAPVFPLKKATLSTSPPVSAVPSSSRSALRLTGPARTTRDGVRDTAWCAGASMPSALRISSGLTAGNPSRRMRAWTPASSMSRSSSFFRPSASAAASTGETPPRSESGRRIHSAVTYALVALLLSLMAFGTLCTALWGNRPGRVGSRKRSDRCVRCPYRFGDAHDVILGEPEPFHILVVLGDEISDVARPRALLANALHFL